MYQIKNILSQETQIREQAVDSTLHDRSEIVRGLISFVDPVNAKKYSDETRCASAYLLGEFRAIEAVPVLSQVLVDEPGPKDTFGIDRYAAPVWTALVRIGRPAVPAMVENIEASDDKILRKKSLGVLYHVLGGKRRVLELLTKLQGKTKDRSKVQRVQSAIQHIQAYFKEDEEPLY
jgi:HEAT repeat protein